MPIFDSQYGTKNTPVDNDKVLIADSENSQAIKGVKISAIVAKAVAAAVAAVGALTNWITTAMLQNGAVTAAKRSEVVKIGTFTVTSGVTGNKSITGVGFIPKTVILFPMYPEGVSSAQNAPFAMGAMDAATQFVYAAVTRNGNGGATKSYTNKCLLINTIAAGGGSQAENIRASYVSMDADGFTINVEVSLTTCVVGFVAIA